MPLVDTGLVVRYPLDDAASGLITTAAQVTDIGPHAYHLTDLNAGSSALSWTEVGGNRGLVCSSTAGTQRARRAMANSADAVRTALEGGNKFTIELVLDSGTLGASGNGRWIAVTNRAGANGELALRLAAASNTWNLSFNDTATSNFSDTTSGRHVLHVVVDSTQATQNNRVRFSINGGALSQVTNTIGLNATLALAADLDLILFNRESSGSYDRSIAGTLYYAAIYTHAFSSTDITTNYDILTLDDDPTSGGGGGGGISLPPIYPQSRRIARLLNF